jgi:glycerol-3-phosphate dehydrogenase (NAD(P)+)
MSLAPITVLGAGSWGTALAVLIARNGRRVHLWGPDAARLATLQHERENRRYLPGIRFPEHLNTRDDLAAACRESNDILVAVPSHAFRATLEALVPHRRDGALLAWATKGLEPRSGKLLSEVVRESLGDGRDTAVISGPSFAREVAIGLPTALTAAAAETAVAEAVAAWLRSDRLRVYTSCDVAGVQLGGAIKNVIAIAAGISDGLGFGANARAALITRGLAELTRLGVALGGRAETFMGLTGAGDLILTCTDNSSRNRRLGLGLGEGRPLAAMLATIGQEVEGVATARELHQLAARRGIEMPITEQVYRVLYEDVAPQAAVEALLSREPKPE